MQRRKQPYIFFIFLFLTGIIIYIASEQPQLLPKSNDHAGYYPEPDYAIGLSE